MVARMERGLSELRGDITGRLDKMSEKWTARNEARPHHDRCRSVARRVARRVDCRHRRDLLLAFAWAIAELRKQ